MTSSTKQCVICHQQALGNARSVTCGRADCQKEHNRRKMRVYQRQHRARLEAELKNPGVCDACQLQVEGRYPLTFQGYTTQLCRCCRTVVHLYGNSPARLRAALEFIELLRERPAEPPLVVDELSA